jgi:hypothetical protein
MPHDFNIALCFILISFLFLLYYFLSFYFGVCLKRGAQWVTEQGKNLFFEYIKFKLSQLIRLRKIFYCKLPHMMILFNGNEILLLNYAKHSIPMALKLRLFRSKQVVDFCHCFQLFFKNWESCWMKFNANFPIMEIKHLCCKKCSQICVSKMSFWDLETKLPHLQMFSANNFQK